MIRRRRSAHSAQYRAHLASPQWEAIRKAALARAGHSCAYCDSRKRLEVHHKHYRNLGHEQPEDLTVLCDNCHKAADRQRRLMARGRIARFRQRRKTGRKVWRALPRVVRVFITLTAAVCLAPIYLPWFGEGVLVGNSCERPDRAVRLYLSKAKYPNVTAHIKESWREGYPHVLRINRDGADRRRDKLIARYERSHPQPEGDGLDLDERPAAMLRRRAYEASVRPIPESENRSEGSRMGRKLSAYCDGTRVMYVFTR